MNARIRRLAACAAAGMTAAALTLTARPATAQGHGAVLNTAGLRALEIADTAADPLGGWYERDAAGRLTGGMYEYAEWGALRRLYSKGSERALVAGLRAFADSALRLGVTSVQDMAGYVDPAIAGDSTAALVLNVMEALAPDSVWRPRRVRFEHGGQIAGPQIARARRLGVVIAQPRAEGAPLRAWTSAGIPVAYGSDMLRNPFYYMMAAVTEPTVPGQAISREAAVAMLTRAPAYAEFTERDKGTLAPGMLADLAVLSQDVFTVPPQALPATTSVLTIVGGRVVYDHRHAA